MPPQVLFTVQVRPLLPAIAPRQYVDSGPHYVVNRIVTEKALRPVRSGTLHVFAYFQIIVYSISTQCECLLYLLIGEEPGILSCLCKETSCRIDIGK